MLPKIKPILPFLVGSLFGLISFPVTFSAIGGGGGSDLLMPVYMLVWYSGGLVDLLPVRETIPDLEIFLRFCFFPAVISGTIFQIIYLLVKQVVRLIRRGKR